MAEFGLRYPCFKKSGSSKGLLLGKAVVANLTVTLASGELYADDGLAEQLSEFASGSLAMETDNMADAIAGALYGCTVTNGLVVYNKNDTAPEGTAGYMKVLMVRGVKKYRVYIYPRAKAALGNDNGQTRGSSITFQTAQTTFTIFADDKGDWRHTKEFDDEAVAKAYLFEQCGIDAESSDVANAKLSALTVGTLRLTPAFNADVTEYTAETTASSDSVTAIAADSGANVAISVDGTPVTNGGAAAWNSGENTLSIAVTNGTETRTYTVKVTKS